MLIFSRAIISTDWSPAVRWWRWRCGSEWWWARVSYFRFVSVGLQNARDCRAELSYAVYQQTGLNQPTYLVFADMLTQYLNNALWSSYVTQTTDRGSSGRSHCSRAVVVTSSPPRRRGWLESGWLSTSASPSSWSSLPAVTQLAVITPPGPSIQHTELWFPTNRRSMQHQSATPHSGDTRRMWRGRGPGSASRHCAIISGYTITSTNSR